MSEICGLASISIKEVSNLFLTVAGTTEVYCVLSVDRQIVRTSTSNVSSGGVAEWFEERYVFDITNTSATCSIVLWGVASAFPTGKMLGQFALPFSALLLEKEENVAPLVDTDGKTILGNLRYHTQYSRVSHERRICYDDFVMLKFLGRGSFGKVMLVKKKDTGRLYAMKVMRKDKLYRESAIALPLTERDVLKKYNHPYVVHLKFAFQTETHLYMVMDYLSGGDLFDLMVSKNSFDEDTTRFYAAQIVLAISFLHEHDIIYRDLKPENLLLDMNGNMCLVDFGLCKEGMLGEQVTHTFCGSLQYMAPEILKGEGYGKTVDWWALGVIIYEMLTGVHPFLGSHNPGSFSEREIIHGIIHENVQFSAKFGCMSKSAVKLLSHLLQKDPRRRMGAGPKGHEDIKNHPFFDGIDWKKLARKEVMPPFKPHLSDSSLEKKKDPWANVEHSSSPTFEILNDTEQECFQSFSYTCPSELSRSRSSPAFRLLRLSKSPHTSPGNTISPRLFNGMSSSPQQTSPLSPRSGVGGFKIVRSQGFNGLADITEDGTEDHDDIADLIDDGLQDGDGSEVDTTPNFRRQRRRWSLSNFQVNKLTSSSEESGENPNDLAVDSAGSGDDEELRSSGETKSEKQKKKSFLHTLFGKNGKK